MSHFSNVICCNIAYFIHFSVRKPKRQAFQCIRQLVLINRNISIFIIFSDHPLPIIVLAASYTLVIIVCWPISNYKRN